MKPIRISVNFGTSDQKIKSKLKKKAGKNGTVNGYIVELIKKDLK